MSGTACTPDVETDASPFWEGTNADYKGCKNLYRRPGESDQEFVDRNFKHLSPELKVECYDGFLWYHEDDSDAVSKFQKTVCEIELKGKKKIKIALYDGVEFVSLEGSELQKLDKTFERSTFCFIFLSKAFVQDKWSKLIADSLLMKTIYSVEKQWCVLPVITAPRRKLGFEIPFGLNALREVKFYPGNELFVSCIKKLIQDKIHEREMKEQQMQNKRLAFLQKQIKHTSKQNGLGESTAACKSQAELGESMADCKVQDGEHISGATNHTSKKQENDHDLETDGCRDETTKCFSISKETLNVKPDNANVYGSFQKRIDDKDYMRNVRILAKASKSVGLICNPDCSGTGFRVGSKYLATAYHVIVDIAGENGEISERKLQSDDCYVRFEYLRQNDIPHDDCIFHLHKVAYQDKHLDTIILEMKKSEGKDFPPAIPMISKLNKKNHVYLISHHLGLPQILDPKIEFYNLDIEDVQKSVKWATDKGIKLGRGYDDVNDSSKVLFHCASSKGASGALGVMVDQHLNIPQGVLMFLRGYPDFLYGNQSFTDDEKSRFLVVEQGVLLSSVYNDMCSEGKFTAIVEDINLSLKNQTGLE